MKAIEYVAPEHGKLDYSINIDLSQFNSITEVIKEFKKTLNSIFGKHKKYWALIRNINFYNTPKNSKFVSGLIEKLYKTLTKNFIYIKYKFMFEDENQYFMFYKTPLSLEHFDTFEISNYKYFMNDIVSSIFNIKDIKYLFKNFSEIKINNKLRLYYENNLPKVDDISFLSLNEVAFLYNNFYDKVYGEFKDIFFDRIPVNVLNHYKDEIKGIMIKNDKGNIFIDIDIDRNSKMLHLDRLYTAILENDKYVFSNSKTRNLTITTNINDIDNLSEINKIFDTFIKNIDFYISNDSIDKFTNIMFYGDYNDKIKLKIFYYKDLDNFWVVLTPIHNTIFEKLRNKFKIDSFDNTPVEYMFLVIDENLERIKSLSSKYNTIIILPHITISDGRAETSLYNRYNALFNLFKNKEIFFNMKILNPISLLCM